MSSSRMQSGARVCVFGAGSVGCYLGGRLLAAGTDVRFVGRAYIRDEIAVHGLTVSDLQGVEHRLAADRIAFDETAEGADIVLVTVKTAATRAVAGTLADTLAPGVVVASFQNGLHNAEWLRAALPRQTVLTGMIPYNVLHRGEGRFHQGSGGNLMLERHPAAVPLQQTLARAGLDLRLRDDMTAVLWAKLLLNLNNAVNALSGRKLREELSQRPYRHCLAAAQREGLAAMAGAGIRPARLTPLPARWFPTLLDLPDAWFRRLVRGALTIDPLARSSMWEDLERGRATEIDWINGEIIALAESQGRAAPVNSALRRLVRAAEQGGRRDWSGPELWAEVSATGKSSPAGG